MENMNSFVFTADNSRRCPSCKAIFTKEAKYCPHCGMELDKTIVIDNKTVPLPGAGDTTPLYTNKAGYIIRTANGQKIMLNTRDTLSIGSYRYECDYCVNNSALSRVHAVILRRDQKYSIKDLGSRNHSYVNGKELEPNVEQPLKNGDVILLADEQFTFGIE